MRIDRERPGLLLGIRCQWKTWRWLWSNSPDTGSGCWGDQFLTDFSRRGSQLRGIEGRGCFLLVPGEHWGLRNRHHRKPQYAVPSERWVNIQDSRMTDRGRVRTAVSGASGEKEGRTSQLRNQGGRSLHKMGLGRLRPPTSRLSGSQQIGPIPAFRRTFHGWDARSAILFRQTCRNLPGCTDTLTGPLRRWTGPESAIQRLKRTRL